MGNSLAPDMKNIEVILQCAGWKIVANALAFSYGVLSDLDAILSQIGSEHTPELGKLFEHCVPHNTAIMIYGPRASRGWDAIIDETMHLDIAVD